MSILILLFIVTLASCTPQQEPIDFAQVLNDAEARSNQAKALSEDTLLCHALEYYQNER